MSLHEGIQRIFCEGSLSEPPDIYSPEKNLDLINAKRVSRLQI